MKDGFYSIGDISAATGVSVAMLRYYEKMGLIEPAYVNKETGYRYYDAVNFWEVETVYICRRLDIPVKKLQELKQDKSLSELLSHIHHSAISATKKLRRYAILRDDLLFFEEQWKRCFEIKQHPCDTVFFKWLPEKRAAFFPACELSPALRNETTEIQYFELHKCMQEMLKYTRENHYSARVQYGYSLSANEFAKGNIALCGETAEIPSLALLPDNRIVSIPAGNYICCYAEIFKSDSWITLMNDYLCEHGFTPERVYLKNVGIYPYDYTECVFEVMILTS